MVNFLGIGAQKCASSWIYEVLKNSDQIKVSETKELDFFSYHFDKGYEWYHSNFDDSNAEFYGEISPSYFYNSDVPKRVYDYNPNMKIILSLRDPIERMYSNHLHEVRAENITGENTIFENGFINNPLYLEQSLYAKQLKKWLSVFERKNIFIVFQEDVKKNPQEVSDNLCEFLGIAKLPLLEVNAVNASVKNKNELLGKTLEMGGNVLRKLGMKKVLNNLKSSDLLGSIYHSNKVHISKVVAPIDPCFKNKLQHQFLEYDDELKNILDIPSLPWEE